MTLAPSIVAQVAAAQDIDLGMAEAIVGTVFEALSQAVLNGEGVTLPGIGRFRNVAVAERRDHHPSTGAPLIIPGSTTFIFEAI